MDGMTVPERMQFYSDLAQSVGIVTIVAILIYVVAMLRSAIAKGSKRLQHVLAEQAVLHANVDRQGLRIEALEGRNDAARDARLAALVQRLEALETKRNPDAK
jgi:hypothetical protein